MGLTHDKDETMNAIRELLQEHFALLQIGISAFFILMWLRSRANEASKSGFRVREADRNLQFRRESPELAAKTKSSESKKRPLRLTGIVIEGAPHEVLGVSALASESEIQKAYKQKMKQYHPDLMGPPGSREWLETTKIAEAINRARIEMLDRLKRRS